MNIVAYHQPQHDISAQFFPYFIHLNSPENFGAPFLSLTKKNYRFWGEITCEVAMMWPEDNVGSRLVWWFWLIKSLGKIIQNPAIDLMVLINRKFVPGESQISHTNSLSCSCHAPTTTTTPPPPPLHHQQLPSWKANLFLKKHDHKIAQGLVEKPCPFF